MDSSEVGRFGTLRLMKRLEPDKVVASYPIDDEEVTFGRDQSCSIRLYYETVSSIHCKLIFRDRKAFLVVLGVNGVTVDGCPVFPAAGPSAQPVTVPLPNNSTIEIHKKRFQFSYPPKELRAALISTPTRPQEATPDRRRRRRTLRMSMIQSAQVFTPRPSHDPRENLRILKTPIKSPFVMPDRGRRLSSPLKRGPYIPEEDEEEEEEDEEDIVLVESNHPRVVEEDRDLVILEHVVVPEPEPEPEPEHTPQRTVQYPIPPSAQPPAHMQQTPPPARRRGPRASLHRAVLIRSAHRSALQREMEAEEEREAEEVEEIFEEVDGMQDLPPDQEDEAQEGREQAQEDEEDEGEQHQQTPGTVSGWRKSLNVVKGWAFGGSPAQVAQEGNEDYHHEPEEEEAVEAEFEEGEEPGITPTPEPDEDEEYEYDENNMDVEPEEPQYQAPMPPPATTRGPFAVPNRPLGQFMTPQAPRHANFGARQNKSRSHVRYSVGGFTPGGIYGGAATLTPGPSQGHGVSGPRRVRLVEPWKVSDITVPLNDHEEQPQEEHREEEEVNLMGTPRRTVPLSPSKRERISEEERKAIIQRRRSALTEPDFFGGQTPGRRLSLFPPLSPAKAIAKPLFTVDESPRAARSAPSSHPEPKPEPEEEKEDTSVLLARMKHMVEDVKRRQSMGPRPSLGGALATPRKSSGGFSLLAPDPGSAPVREVEVDGEQDEDEEDVSDKENEVAVGQPGRRRAEDFEPEHEDVQMDVEEVVHENNDVRRPVSSNSANLQTPRLEGLKHMFSTQPTATPSFQGVRQMFNRPAPSAALETPRVEGVRHMFNRAEGAAAATTAGGHGAVKELYQQVMSTPTFEGIGEMLGTPAGYQAAPTGDAPEENEEEQGSEQEEREEAPSVKPTRSRKPASQQKTSATRRTSPRVAAATAEGSAEEDEVSVPAPPARGSRRTRGKTAESDAEHDASEPATAPKTTRRTRKTTPSPAPPEPEMSTRSTRKTRTKTPTPTPEDAPAAATRASSSRRRARSPIVEEDEDDDEDPIDALHGRGPSPEVPDPEYTAPSPKPESKVRRSGRAKLTMQIKEEDIDDSPTPPAPEKEKPASKEPAARTGVARAVRGRKPAGSTAAASSIPRTSSIPRGTGRGAKTAGVKRATPAASKQAATEAKENTPEPDEDEPLPQAAGKPSASRTVPRAAPRVGARAVGRTRAASVDQPEKPVEVGKTRVSRTKAGAKK